MPRATILVESSGAAALGLSLIDIDHLKRSNDDDGHAVRSNATPDRDLTRDRLRENDLLARYSGEELIAVPPSATLAICDSPKRRRKFASFTVKAQLEQGLVAQAKRETERLR